MMQMRRFKQQLAESEAKEILRTSTNGILSLIDPVGNPYGVPMSFVFDGEKSIYFHCAREGKKLECIAHNPCCCFTVVDMDEIHPDEFTTYFRSVIVSGKISVVPTKEEMLLALRSLSGKYSPGIDCEPEIDKGISRVVVLKLDIENITGKEAVELLRRRNN